MAKGQISRRRFEKYIQVGMAAIMHPSIWLAAVAMDGDVRWLVQIITMATTPSRAVRPNIPTNERNPYHFMVFSPNAASAVSSIRHAAKMSV